MFLILHQCNFAKLHRQLKCKALISLRANDTFGPDSTFKLILVNTINIFYQLHLLLNFGESFSLQTNYVKRK